MKKALIIFIRNPIAGEVKTRLANTMGPEKALLIYKILLQHTCEITEQLDCDKFVYYADFINENDSWQNDNFHKRLQHGADLGERMSNAFNQLFNEGYERLLIIGSDCLELESKLISHAFDVLDETDIVVGPSADGGYYLLGMKPPLLSFLFENKSWSTGSVLTETIKDLTTSGIRFELLVTLNDIDEEKDVPQYLLEQINLDAES
ncbi:MAG: TIGR04282 family arsenosugar biosynthesis glycosyltransferase [Ferruginibacter sp.]